MGNDQRRMSFGSPVRYRGFATVDHAGQGRQINLTAESIGSKVSSASDEIARCWFRNLFKSGHLNRRAIACFDVERRLEMGSAENLRQVRHLDATANA